MSNKVMELGKNLWVYGQKNKPAVLSGFAVAGLWGTLWYSYKHAPIAHKILEEARKDMEYVEPGDRETKRSVVKRTTLKLIPHVVPPIVGAGVTTACIFGSLKESSKRIATLSAAYAVSDTALKELNSKLNEVLGEKKAKTVKDAIAEDHLRKNEKKRKGVDQPVVVVGTGDVLCMDSYTGQFFYSNAQKIGQAINTMSARCMTEMYVSLNEFFDELNAPGLKRVTMGDDFGWGVDDLNEGQLPISISALLTETKEPCLCVEYDIGLRSDYRNLY